MQRLAVLLASGLVTAGISTALVAGAGVAVADTESAADTGTTTSASTTSDSSTTKETSATKDSPADEETPKDTEKATEEDSQKDTEEAEGTEQAEPEETEAEEAKPEEAKPEETKPEESKPEEAKPEVTTTAGAEVEDTDTEKSSAKTPEPEAPAPAVATSAARKTAAVEVAATVSQTPAPVPVPVPTGLPAVLAFVGNVVFGALTLLEQTVNGPPTVPPGSSVVVRTSGLQIVDGFVVRANWYFPDTDTPPERMVLLQHGFLATGPMYSYTAAELAQRTNSIVVTPTLVSNFLAGNGLWLGGDAMFRAVANLFYGDRTSLNASADAAGYLSRYGLSADAVLPQQFALAGHSLGGALVSGVSGYLAENGAADNLVGVILLDGVPTGSTLPDALKRLQTYQDGGGRFVPVREIGAPRNIWNFISNVNESLDTYRPDNYKGVVLAGGVHMDSMQGGNPLIQFAAYLAAGFPQPQNPPAVQELASTWLDEWFDGFPHIGDDLVAGTSIVIPTPKGDATGVVIGTVPATIAARLEDVTV